MVSKARQGWERERMARSECKNLRGRCLPLEAMESKILTVQRIYNSNPHSPMYNFSLHPLPSNLVPKTSLDNKKI